MTPRIKETKDPNKLVQSAIFAIKRKKWSKARRKFEAALNDEEIQKNAGVWANYGVALTNLKLISEAQKAFTQAVSLDKKNARLWLKKGLTESKLENYSEASKSFQKAMQYDKNDPEIPILLSRALRKQDDVKKAIKVLESAHKKLPTSHQIPIELAMVWTNQNNDLKAEQVLKKAIPTTNNPDPGLILGQAYLDKKNYKQAITIYEELKSLFPQSEHVEYGLGVAHHANGDWQKALESYQQAMQLFRPGKPPQSLFINMARVLKNLKRHKDAINTLYQAKKYGKPNIEIALLFTELFLETNRPNRAKRALEDAVLLDKRNPVLHFYLGLTLLQLKDKSQAKENFKRSLELNPEYHEAKLQLSLLAIQEKDFETAYNLANEVAIADPNHITGNRLTAKLAFDLRKFRRSIELIKPIVIEDPLNRKEDLELLLNSWLLLSKPEKAREFIKSLSKKYPNLKNELKSRSFFDQFF